MTAPPDQECRGETGRAAVYADILLDNPALELPGRTFTYTVPEDLLGDISLGSPVIVPFGHQAAVGGVVVGLGPTPPLPDVTYRPIAAAIRGQIFDATYLDWLSWIADRYVCPLSQVIQAAIPSGLLARCERVIRLSCDTQVVEDLARVRNQRQQELKTCLSSLKASYPEAIPYSAARRMLGPQAPRLVRWLREQGIVTLEYRLVPPRSRPRTQLHVILAHTEEAKPITRRQEEVLRVLAAAGGTLPMTRFLELAGTEPGVLRRLEKAGRLVVSRQEVRREPLAGMTPEPSRPLELTAAQRRALGIILDAVDGGRHEVFLLHGVTGSGKTEVYLQAIAAVLAQGRQAIVLVPEIALTPQTLRRFRHRFGEQVAVWHSSLGAGERHDEWHRILAGTARIVVGTRSAIFAPCRRLGLIVLDEEHETTYKQEEPAPRYHARTVGLERARRAGAAVVLGSATPSLESYHAARQEGHYLLILPERVENRPLPPVSVVDMRVELASGNRSIFSRRLQEAVGMRLERGEQTILFLNRRGYATFVLCRTCGESLRCPHCAVSLIYHADGTSLQCHYCEYRAAPVALCPTCGSPRIRHFGTGTQKVEAAVQSAFPRARVLRLDRDTVRRKASHHEILESFRREEADVLIGTQMVAKGLDFPKITLVGVLAADAVLNLPDFRAAERNFQLITQVAGRSGRSELGGEVIVQTYAPNHPSIRAAAEYRCEDFYQAELAERQGLGYPPFGELISLVITSSQSGLGVQSAREIAGKLKDHSSSGSDQVLGPVPAVLAKLRGEYRQQILIKCHSIGDWTGTLRELQGEHPWPPGVRVTIDIEPGYLH